VGAGRGEEPRQEARRTIDGRLAPRPADGVEADEVNRGVETGRDVAEKVRRELRPLGFAGVRRRREHDGIRWRSID